MIASLRKILLLFVMMAPLIGSFHAAPAVFAAPAPVKTLTLFGIDLHCDPSLAPDDVNGCGPRAFIYFIKEMITYLTILIIPIAVIIIIWGGFMILLAGGSPEKMGKGKSIITAAVIGIAITFGAWLIVNTIYLALTGAGVN